LSGGLIAGLQVLRELLLRCASFRPLGRWRFTSRARQYGTDDKEVAEV
jgi:hypothetical protein